MTTNRCEYPGASVYLNDHLAGSVVAIDLLEHMEKEHAGTPLESYFAKLRNDITADQRELEALMQRLSITPSSPRKALAWLSEKVTRLKLRLDDPSGGALRLLESLELLAVGIDGKRALWAALVAASDGNPALRGPDYPLLDRRAEEQRDRVEEERLKAAQTALAMRS